MNDDHVLAAGGRMVTMVGLSARAVPGKRVFTASAILRAVVKSGLRRVMRISPMLASWKPISRSTMAPPAIRPAVGTPLETEEPEAPPAEMEPVCTVPWLTA